MVLIAMAPGLIGIISLHPYEYIYYNEIVGGVDGAAGHYYADYWCTSFREAMKYVNQVAPPNGCCGGGWWPVQRGWFPTERPLH